MHSQQFIDALRQVEDHHKLDPMLQLFADNATLWNPDLGRTLKGQDGAREFWEQYLGTFASVHSTFCETIETKDHIALEWESRGKIAGVNQPFCYRGVTLLDWQDDKICRLAAYFDSLALSVSPQLAQSRSAQADQQANRASGR